MQKTELDNPSPLTVAVDNFYVLDNIFFTGSPTIAI
jgi:hypothetical protein